MVAKMPLPRTCSIGGRAVPERRVTLTRWAKWKGGFPGRSARQTGEVGWIFATSFSTCEGSSIGCSRRAAVLGTLNPFASRLTGYHSRFVNDAVRTSVENVDTATPPKPNESPRGDCGRGSRCVSTDSEHTKRKNPSSVLRYCYGNEVGGSSPPPRTLF